MAVHNFYIFTKYEQNQSFTYDLLPFMKHERIKILNVWIAPIFLLSVQRLS